MGQRATGIISDERRPHASWQPYRVHQRSRLHIIVPQNLSLPTIKKGGYSHVRNAMDMHWPAFQLSHHVTELSEVFFGWSIEVHRDVDISQAKTIKRGSFIRKSLFMCVQPKIYHVPNAKLGKLGELLFGGLA
ncbi:hypothetical protein BV96_02686 [Sphingomonas paucimobilis]|nr:hypothetical protein BV96_02686 [Sphingomonas paucimobilis]